jgi:hypothetical protein
LKHSTLEKEKVKNATQLLENTESAGEEKPLHQVTFLPEGRCSSGFAPSQKPYSWFAMSRRTPWTILSIVGG